MIPLIDSGALASDLDCRNFRILNLGELLPTPPTFTGTDDTRLYDPRPILDGTVTNEGVASTAAIDQDKLLLNGLIPPAWIGNSPGKAAKGDAVERVANKGEPNGYASADENGNLLSGNVEPGLSSGTLNTALLRMPVQFFTLTPMIIDSGTWGVGWNDVPDNSWFGVGDIPSLSSVISPSFLTGEIPLSLVPDLDASKVTSGVFNQERFPVCVGMGVDHSVGFVPDPGPHGDANDYLGRDMEWHAFTQDQGYQPTVPDVLIQINSDDSVTIRSTLKGSTLFYRTAINFVRATPSTSDVKITLPILPNNFVQAYAAKPGYNNSPIASLVLT